MRLWGRESNTGWTTDTGPSLKPGDRRTVIMILGVWIGFVLAIHFADAPPLCAAVEHINHTLNPLLNFQRAPAPLDNDALIVTADRNTELTAVATLSPRGFHPVIASGAQDALARARAAGPIWKMVVIDAALPGAAGLTRTMRQDLPAATIVAVQGHRGAQAVSRALINRLSAPPKETVAD